MSETDETDERNVVREYVISNKCKQIIFDFEVVKTLPLTHWTLHDRVLQEKKIRITSLFPYTKENYKNYEKYSTDEIRQKLLKVKKHIAVCDSDGNYRRREPDDDFTTRELYNSYDVEVCWRRNSDKFSVKGRSIFRGFFDIDWEWEQLESSSDLVLKAIDLSEEPRIIAKFERSESIPEEIGKVLIFVRLEDSLYSAIAISAAYSVANLMNEKMLNPSDS